VADQRHARLLREVDFAEIEKVGKDRRPGGRSPSWGADLKSRLNVQLSKHCEWAATHRRLDVQTLDANSRKKVLNAFRILEGTRERLIEGGANAVVNHEWKRFYHCLDRARRLIELPRKAGRTANTWLDEFIVILAAAYHLAGGNVSAQPDRDGILETPFLRVLRVAFNRLPKKLQSGTTLPALDVRARRIMPRWRTRAELRGYFG
jgi:hypothetical protein